MTLKTIITTSWDDGHPLDLKLSKLLKKYKIEGTMYVPITNPENQVIDSSKIKDTAQNFEIGGHTLNHSILTELSDEKIDFELRKSKETLEKITGKEIISFCYPRGQYNKKIMKKVKEAGYKGGRTSEIFRISYNNPYELHTTVQVVDRILASKGKAVIKSANRSLTKKLLLEGDIFKHCDLIAKKTLDYVLENGGIWHLWGHSWEIEKNNHWLLLEKILKYAQRRGLESGADFVTNGVIFNN